jgi:hypothetical protein
MAGGAGRRYAAGPAQQLSDFAIAIAAILLGQGNDVGCQSLVIALEDLISALCLIL